MTEHDLFPKLLPHLDSQFTLVFLDFYSQHGFYRAEDLQLAKIEYLSKHRMVDYWATEYEAFYKKTPEDAAQRREIVYQEMQTIIEAMGPLSQIVIGSQEENEAATEPLCQILKDEDNFNLPYLNEKYQVTESHFEALFRYGRIYYDIGLYNEAVHYLSYYRLAMSPYNEQRSFEALLGIITCEVLFGSLEAAIPFFNSLMSILDQRIHVDHLEQIELRTWALHASLSIFFQSANGKHMLIETFMQEKQLNTIQLNCPHLFRYLCAAVIIHKRHKNYLPMLMRTLQSVFAEFTLAPSSLAPTYVDPIISFVLSLYVQNDLTKAAEYLHQIQSVANIDYFLYHCANELIASARVLFFEQYCRLHTRVEIAHLSKFIDLSQRVVVDKDNVLTLDTSLDGSQEEKTEETPSSISRAENACVSYIQVCGIDARVGSLSGHLMIHSEYPQFSQQIVDKTRSLIYRSQSLRTSLQKRFAPRKDAPRDEDF